jgi:hypothetical protein
MRGRGRSRWAPPVDDGALLRQREEMRKHIGHHLFRSLYSFTSIFPCASACVRWLDKFP